MFVVGGKRCCGIHMEVGTTLGAGFLLLLVGPGPLTQDVRPGNK